MPDLHFSILSADVKPYAAAPTIVFKLQISNAVEDEEVYAVGLKSQIRIDAVHRKYDKETQKRLIELFGVPERWAETLGSLYWKTITIPVPTFTGKTVLEIPLECSEDMSASVGKYMHSIEDGEVPLAFIFNGTVFYKGPAETLQVTQLSWEKEASYRLPITLWDKLLKAYFPNTKWLRVPHEIFDKLYTYKTKTGLPTLNQCLESLIDKGLEKAQQTKEET